MSMAVKFQFGKATGTLRCPGNIPASTEILEDSAASAEFGDSVPSVQIMEDSATDSDLRCCGCILHIKSQGRHPPNPDPPVHRGRPSNA